MHPFDSIAVAVFPLEGASTERILTSAMNISRWMNADLHVLSCVGRQHEVAHLVQELVSEHQNERPVFLHYIGAGFVEGLFEMLEGCQARMLLVAYGPEFSVLKNTVIEICPVSILLISSTINSL